MSIEEIDEDDDAGDQQDAALESGIVAPADRLDQPFADTRPGEDRLGEDGAGQQRADLQADHGDDGDERVAQRMDADDAEGREALGAGGAHIILLEHLEHRGARHARDHRERDGAKHDGRQNEVAHRVEKGAFLAGEQAVDQHEAGDRLEIIVDEVDAARNRRQVQGSRT